MKTTLRVAAVAIGLIALFGNAAVARPREAPYTTQFKIEDCQFRTEGDNPYFILRPGRLVLEGVVDGDVERVVITILNELESIVIPGIGVVMTRVVQEEETVDGTRVELSRNYFAICRQTNDVFYFGEAVDIFHENGSVTHDGAWRAGEPDANGLAEAGIIMPGRFLLGSHYFQEIAEGVAMDRAEHVAMDLGIATEAGTFHDCVQVRETSPLEPRSETTKVYCRGVGLVVDNELRLVQYHFE